MTRRLFALLLAFPCIACAATFHVATNGDDRNDGSVGQPFATLERARDAVRTNSGSRVMLHRGTYVLQTTVDFGEKDSGIWQAAPNEEVRISGGPVLSANEFSPVSDQKILTRLPEIARAKVMQFKLPGVAPSEYPTKFRGAPESPELFFNDHRMTVARWPNKGWATISKLLERGAVPRDGDTSGKLPSFEFSDAEPLRWDICAGVWLQGYWAYDWYDETIRIASLDREHHRITLAAPALYGVQQGNPAPRRFRAINVLEELDEPGEFYIDRLTRTLYFWPPAPIDKSRVVLSTLKGPLIRIKDAANLRFRGVIFEATLGNGIEITGGHDVAIEGCTVRNTREQAIVIHGGRHHRVDSCDIYDTGTGGIVLDGGDRKTLTPASHEAVNNHIHDFSRHQLTAAYAISLGGVGNLVAHNLIHDAPHQAIFIGGNDHVIEYNVLRDVVSGSNDAGAIYKGRNPSCRGNVIRYNFLANIGSRLGDMTCGVYFDDGDGGDTVFGNVFLHCGGARMGAIFSHGGHGIHADNNVFIDCPRALGSTPWGDALWASAIHGGADCQFPEKLLHEVDITKPPYTTRYPELVGFMDPKPGVPRVSHAVDNVIVRCPAVASGNWQVTKDFRGDSDAIFVNAAGGDYSIKADSDVFKKLPDFKPIPFEQIGLQRSGLRDGASLGR